MNKYEREWNYINNDLIYKKHLNELVERATPMKLNGCKNDWACANCDSDYGIIEGRDYCATCGQALDWDE